MIEINKGKRQTSAVTSCWWWCWKDWNSWRSKAFTTVKEFWLEFKMHQDGSNTEQGEASNVNSSKISHTEGDSCGAYSKRTVRIRPFWPFRADLLSIGTNRPIIADTMEYFNCYLSFSQLRTDLDKIIMSWEALIVTSEPSQPVRQLYLIKVSKWLFIFIIGSNQKCTIW